MSSDARAETAESAARAFSNQAQQAEAEKTTAQDQARQAQASAERSAAVMQEIYDAAQGVVRAEAGDRADVGMAKGGLVEEAETNSAAAEVARLRLQAALERAQPYVRPGGP